MTTHINPLAAAMLAGQKSSATAQARNSVPSPFNREAVIRRIRRAGFEVLASVALPNGTGMKFTLLGGPVVTVYNNGNHLVQGKVSDGDVKRIQRALRAR